MARIALLLLAFAALAGCADGAGEPDQSGSLTPRLNGRAGFYGTIGSGIGH